MAIAKEKSLTKGFRYKPLVKLPDGKWMRSHTFDRLVDAQNEERELIAQKQKTWHYDMFAPLPFDITVDEWIESLKVRKLSASHIIRIEYDMRNYFKPFFAGVDIKAIKPSDIEKFVSTVRERLAPFTINRMVKMLKSFFNFLAEEDRLERNPVKKKSLLPWVAKHLKPVWTMEESKKFLTYLERKYQGDERWFYLFFKVLANCGLRFGEVLAVEKADFDFENNRIRINKSYCSHSFKLKTTKNGKTRYAPLPPSLADEMKDYCAKNQIFGPLFMDKNGSYHSYDKIRGRYIKDVKGANLPYSNIHNHRRAFCMMYLENGGDEVQLRKLVGHSDFSMTDLYTVQRNDLGKIASIVNI